MRILLPATLLIGWLAIGAIGGPYQGRLSEVQRNDNTAWLPANAEATVAAELQEKFSERQLLPAVIVFERADGITEDDVAAVRGRAAALAELPGVQPGITPPIPSTKTDQALQLVVPLSFDDPEQASATIEELSGVIRQDLPAGLDAYLTGPAGLIADFSEAFGDIDSLLLGVAALVVAVILLIVYRSPILPLLVLLSAGLALSAAVLVVYQLADNGTLTLNGQSQGILFILVFGAATDYALLLVARYREELRARPAPWEAMRAAWRASVAPITASAGTVILGLLCLLFSDLNSNKGLGPVGAIGIAASLLVSLTFLPAALVLLGRAAFWPFRPTVGSVGSEQRGIWARVAAAVGRRPRTIWVVTAAVLVGAAMFLPQLRASGTSTEDLFLTEVESVTGQRVLARHFDAGSGSPAVIIARAQAAEEVVDAARSVPGVAQVAVTPAATPVPGQPPPAEPKIVDGLVEINATLADPADSDAAEATVQRLRDAVHGVSGADAKVGGPTATQMDVNATSARDLRTIPPIVLAVIFVILALLLRALVAPVLLIATVVLSFAATLGVSALVFNNVFHFPAADPATPLFAFVFLVALGIDYNIFLMTRVREEALALGTREGTLRGLAVTGGVITSAGVVLAATFGVLAVLPLLFLAQIAFLVAFGVLLDALVVRSLLVPALTVDVGPRVWWPSRLARK
ncbi:MAG TPA: efflux RND transporter permease subunit [Pseudonocardiaceae bacterium]|nr:efflux RND transporter permease subunit [Pseudonocardiaceae bacterium]